MKVEAENIASCGELLYILYKNPSILLRYAVLRLFIKKNGQN